MTTEATITTRGFKRLLRKLDARQYRVAARRIVARGTVEVRDRMAAYPPEGRWNRPDGPGSRWYQRLFGPRWMRADGSIGGRDTSERLQRSWQATVGEKGKHVVGRVYTTVSYAPYVQGNKQPWFHKRHGWKTAKQIVRRWKRERANIIAREEVERIW